MARWMLLCLMSVSFGQVIARDTIWVWSYDTGSRQLVSDNLDYYRANATSPIPNYVQKATKHLDIKFKGSGTCPSATEGCQDGFIKFEWLSDKELGFSLRNLWPNGLNRISTTDFQALDNLEHLDLSYTKISEIEDYSFASLKELKKLKLNSNLLHKLTEYTLIGSKTLYSLDLSENALKTVPANAFLSCVNMRILNLGSNSLLSVGKNSFNGLNNLDRIFLGHNQMTTIRSHTFVRLRRLTVLILRNNNISFIEPGAFDGLPDLKALGVSGNKMILFTPELLYPLRGSLTIMDLDRNEVKLWKDLRTYSESAVSGRSYEGVAASATFPSLRYVSAEESFFPSGNLVEVAPSASYYDNFYNTWRLNNVYKDVSNQSNSRLIQMTGSHFDFSKFFNEDDTSFILGKALSVDCSSVIANIVKTISVLNSEEILHALTFALQHCQNISDAEMDELLELPSKGRPSLFVSVSLPVLLVFVVPTVFCLGRGMFRRYSLKKNFPVAKGEEKKKGVGEEEAIEMKPLNLRRRRSAYSTDMSDYSEASLSFLSSFEHGGCLISTDFSPGPSGGSPSPSVLQPSPTRCGLILTKATVHRSRSSSFESGTSDSPPASSLSHHSDSVGLVYSDDSSDDLKRPSADDNSGSEGLLSSDIGFHTALSSMQSTTSYESALDESL